jgi:hypothetical protein
MRWNASLRDSKSSEQKTTVQRRENRLRDSRKASFGLRLRASLAVPNRVWDLNPVFPLVRFTVAVESNNTQDRSGRLPHWLLV